jgi:hypothetical protein
MPLPFALNHIHLWLVDDGSGGRTIVDTGINNRQTKDCEAPLGDESR